jgi:hypothetical protein
MPWQACAGHSPEIEADVESLALHRLLQPAAPAGEPPLKVEQRNIIKLGKRSPVIKRCDKDVAVGIGVTVEHNDALGSPLNHPQISVMV